MVRILTTLIAAFLLTPVAMAVCTLDPRYGQPTILRIGSQTIQVQADAPADTSTPIARYDSPALTQMIMYNHCADGSEYGKLPLNLGTQDTATELYPTQVPGIGIKLLWSNGSAFGHYPSRGSIPASVGFNWPVGSFFRIEFYKTADSLQLTNPNGDTVLPPNDIAYNYVLNANPATYAMKLAIGEIKIVSTPTCTPDGAKTIDFNDVTPTLLKSGVVRPLNFNIVCKTDYGSYSSAASITTTTPAADGTYIRARDANGNMDRLGIRITNAAGQTMKVDGTNSDSKASVTSRAPAEYRWLATLVPGAQATPAGGKLTAKAEVIFDIQ